MVKSSSALLIAGFICLMSLESLTALTEDADKLSGKRKPLMTRTDPSTLEDYKRTKRQLPQPLQEFQDFVTTSKTQCAKEMNINPNKLQKSLLYEDQPTSMEKCMMECILKRIEVMSKDDTLATTAIGHIADIIGDNNALITSIAVASAENCKKFITAEDSCERAFQINKCIAAEMKMRKIKLIY